MDRLPDLADITTHIRTKLNKKAELCCAITRDNSADFKVINGVEAERLLQTVDVLPRQFLAQISASTSLFLNLPACFPIFRTSKVLLIWKRSLSSLVTVKSDLGAALAHDGRWRLAVNSPLKVALRWPGLWASSNTLTVA